MTPSRLFNCPFTLLFVLFSFCLHAQDEDGPPKEKPDTTWFEIATPPGKVPHSLYRTIEFLDQRPDTILLGMFATNTRCDIRVAPLYPLAIQFNTLLTRLTDTSAGQGALLLQLRRFTIFDINTTFTHKAATSIRAFLYARRGQSYYKMAVLDTTVEQSNGGTFGRSLHKRLLSATSAVLSRFIADALIQPVANDALAYSRLAVSAIDSVEKSHLPLYASDSLIDGVYMHLNSFLQQQPYYTHFLANVTEGTILGLQVSIDSVRTALYPEGVFAVVKNGHAYIFTKEGYKPLKKIGNDFYYVGKIRVAADNLSNLVNFASWATTIATMGGLQLFAMWKMTTKKSFLLKMDYMNGRFTPVRQVDQ